MAIFREFNPIGHDRAAEDRRRHRQLVEDSIKKNLTDILSEESIIGQSKDKKIRIPIRGLIEYQFIYGKNVPGAGSGDGSEKRGDKIGRDEIEGPGNKGAGNQEGEDIYETEITIEDIIGYLFEDLKLPYMERKRFSEILTEESHKRSGYQRKGIPPRLAKKRTVIEKTKRRQSTIRTIHEENLEEDLERFPFKEDDLRYRRVKEDKKRESNAVIICIMDTSGSMSEIKKYLTRAFFFLLYQFVKMKYLKVEVVFIAHSTVARVVNEKEFFHKGQSGGTIISSGYEKALEIIEERYNPEIWNIYSFHASDGENWEEDNEKAVRLGIELCEVCNLFGYVEVITLTSKSIRKEYEANIKKDNFAVVSINKKEDVWPAFKNIMQKDLKEG